MSECHAIAIIEERRSWRERLLSWPWRPWVAWKPSGISGPVTWNGEAFVIVSPPAGDSGPTGERRDD